MHVRKTGRTESVDSWTKRVLRWPSYYGDGSALKDMSIWEENDHVYVQ